MRKGLRSRTNSMRAFSYLTIALAMLFYSLPKLPGFKVASEQGVYVFLWLAFAFLVVGTHLYYLIGADRERRRTDVRDLWSYVSPERKTHRKGNVTQRERKRQY